MSDQKVPTGGLRMFFERFQSLSPVSDVDGLAAMYADNVMIAGASGAQVVRLADLRRAIPKRKQLLESVGPYDTALAGFDETALTDRYSLVRADFRWNFHALKDQPTSVTLPSTFIVDCGGDSPHIVLYMNEWDVASVLRERGMLAPVS